MKLTSVFLVFSVVVCARNCYGQGSYNPYGLDMELIGGCSPSNCPPLDKAIQANATWVRIFVPWNGVEPNQPTAPIQSSVPGQQSGQHTYNWGAIDSTIGYAVNHDLNVYAQIYWTAAWANGNPYPSCDPIAAGASGQCYVNGSPVGNPQGVPPNQTLNIGGVQVAASLALQDFAYNLAVRFPQVQYFGPMNEPNFTNNFNPPEGFSGNYLNDYMNYLAFPVATGIQAANASNQLVGPDVGLSAGADSGLSSWIQPLNQYFSQTFGVWSVHTYRSDHTSVAGDIDSVLSTTSYSKPVWLTETGFLYGGANDQASEVQGVYVDEYNRSSSWTKTFYHSLQDYSGAPASQFYGLIDQYGNARPAFTTYQTLYGR